MEDKSTVVERSEEDKIVVDSKAIHFSPGRQTSLEISVKQTNLDNQAPGLRFMVYARTSGTDELWLPVGWQIDNKVKIKRSSIYWGESNSNCTEEYAAGSIASFAFESIRTNYQDKEATAVVGLGCPSGSTEEVTDSLYAFDGLEDTKNNEYAVFVFPVDTAEDKAVKNRDYGYLLTVTCDGESCNQ